MREHTSQTSLEFGNVSAEPRRRPPQPERRTRPGRGVASCKYERPVGAAFCHTCGRLILPAEPEP
jgi:hypothetical protein